MFGPLRELEVWLMVPFVLPSPQRSGRQSVFLLSAQSASGIGSRTTDTRTTEPADKGWAVIDEIVHNVMFNPGLHPHVNLNEEAHESDGTVRLVAAEQGPLNRRARVETPSSPRGGGRYSMRT